jgi:hypothetical protein
MTITELQTLYAEVFSRWVRDLDLELRATSTSALR